jgi:hypothetical protein
MAMAWRRKVERHKRAWLQKFFEHGDGIALVPDERQRHGFKSTRQRLTRSAGLHQKSSSSGQMEAGARALERERHYSRLVLVR